MDRLVLFAHGSRSAGWSAPFEELAAKVTAKVGADAVALAYLDLCEPSLEEVAALAVRDGVETLRILPLFMSGRGHVLRDLPSRCDALGERYRSLVIEVLPSVGEHPRVVAAIIDIAADGSVA